MEVWAVEAGISAPHLRVADFGGLRGMAATADIEAGEPLVSLPIGAALLVTPKQRCPFPDFCSPAFYASKPCRAFSGPYGGPPWRSRAKLAAALVAGGVGSVTALHVPLEQVLNGAVAAALFNLIYDYLLSQRVKWYSMVPWLDLINHRGTVESTVEYEYFRDRFVASTTSRRFRKGEQVLISYGPQSNDSLLQFYGFVEAGNPHDAYRVPDLAARARAAAASMGLKLQAAPSGASSIGSAPDTAGTLTRGGPDEHTLAAITAEVASARPSADGVTAVQRALEVAAALCDAELDVLGPVDRPRGAAPQLQSARAAAAAAFRHEKAAVLQDCARACRQRAKRKTP
ncbi:hypothetical protein WJX81_004671 [Elliptochloris bilobata]|uniref:SET domain-containing protein n=1 Tax=Elliptochloris bilobata TaxID=381761 RepID=A0AAW1RSD9_9CHLO